MANPTDSKVTCDFYSILNIDETPGEVGLCLCSIVPERGQRTLSLGDLSGLMTTEAQTQNQAALCRQQTNRNKLHVRCILHEIHRLYSLVRSFWWPTPPG